MNNLIDYLQNDPLHYDFTDDCTDHPEYQRKKGYDKYFIYRCPKPEGKGIYPAADTVIEDNYQRYGKIGDPDSESKLLQNIYTQLWPEIKEQESEYRINNKNWIYSDTVISIQTTLNNYIGKEMPELLKEYGVKRVSNKMCIELYETNPTLKELLNKSEDLLHLVTVYHTLGNYIPVCYGFNMARSGYYGSHDYWDLTLMKIKEYYDKRAVQSGFQDLRCRPEVKIMELLHCDRGLICCYQWLNRYEDWKDFINKNFLQDFVDIDDRPIPLCKGHSWEEPQVKNFEEFFKNSWQIIEKRSARMIKMLEKKVCKTN